MAAPLTCWVISDGRRGIENQALGLAEALSDRQTLNITQQIVTNGKLFGLLPPWTQFRLRKSPDRYFKHESAPDMAIGCGRAAIAPLLALKRQHKDNIFTVYVQSPRMNPYYFDAVIAPEHDRLTGPNVFNMIGSPNRITEQALEADKDLIAKPKGETAAFLIGGTSKSRALTPDIHKQHLELIKALAGDGIHVFVTTSRRTPSDVVADYKKLNGEADFVTAYTGDGPNPYFAYLRHADRIFVTEDSTNMLTEACATGKPVFRLPMAGSPGKFQQLYDALEKRCRVRPALESDLTSQSYAPLDETGRAADFIRDKFHKMV